MSKPCMIRRSKRAWLNCVLCIPLIFRGSPNKCWLRTCDACIITTWRSGLWAPFVAHNYGAFKTYDFIKMCTARQAVWQKSPYQWKSPKESAYIYDIFTKMHEMPKLIKLALIFLTLKITNGWFQKISIVTPWKVINSFLTKSSYEL